MLGALDSLTLSGRQKAEEGGVELRLLSAGKEWSAVDSNLHQRGLQLLAVKDDRGDGQLMPRRSR